MTSYPQYTAFTANDGYETEPVTHEQIADAVERGTAAILLKYGPTHAPVYNWYAALVIDDDPTLYHGYAGICTNPTLRQALQVAEIGRCN